MEQPTLIPKYLEAKTKDELIVLMFEKNQQMSAFHRYFDIQKDGKNWVAWYFVDLKEEARRGIQTN